MRSCAAIVLLVALAILLGLCAYTAWTVEVLWQLLQA
jgi:hypothetical protein